MNSIKPDHTATVASVSKKCCLCGSTKPLVDFAKGDGGKRKSYCKTCDAETHARYRAIHGDRLNAQRRKKCQNDPRINRNYNLRQHYGITLAQWEEMFDAQGRSCKICKTTTPKGRGWQTDHNHSTGRIRGVLCHHCNALIGHAMENSTILLATIEYLK